jgi:hypothetical protein
MAWEDVLWSNPTTRESLELLHDRVTWSKANGYQQRTSSRETGVGGALQALGHRVQVLIEGGDRGRHPIEAVQIKLSILATCLFQAFLQFAISYDRRHEILRKIQQVVQANN